MDVLPSSFGAFSYTCNYTLFDTSVIHKPSFTHADSNLVDFLSEQECCYLVLTKIQSVCNYLCTSLIIQAINQMLLKCKHGHCHHTLYLFLLNKHSSSFFEVFLIAPFFCLQKTEYVFQLHFSKACGYIHTYTHTGGWGGVGCWCWHVEEETGAGRDRERLPVCAWKHTPSLPDWKVWKEEIVIQQFKKHLPHHLCAENRTTEKSLSQDNVVSFSNTSG